MDNTISLISKTKYLADRYIIGELEKLGLEGIATSHGDIIMALIRHDSLTMRELASTIGKDPSTVTTLVRKLVQLGYLTTAQDEVDRRVQRVQLTYHGLKLKEGVMQISEKLFALQYRGIDEQDVAVFRKVLQAMQRNLGDANDNQ